jgi:hypothetical protein
MTTGTGRRPGGRRALAGLAAGAALLLGPPALWLGYDPPPAPLAAAPTVAPVALPAPRVAGLVDRGAEHAADRAAPAPRPAAPPVRVRLAGIGVDAPVEAVGVDRRGEMAVPLDVGVVGWYRFGPGPGGVAGSAVLSGHVDDHVQGRGAFYRLGELTVDAPVSVELADGTVVGYRVRSVEHVAKSGLPVGRVFDRAGTPRLTLVTCGGPFDRGAGGYSDNVIVTAEPGAPA